MTSSSLVMTDRSDATAGRSGNVIDVPTISRFFGTTIATYSTIAGTRTSAPATWTGREDPNE